MSMMLSTQRGMELHHVHVATALLNGTLHMSGGEDTFYIGVYVDDMVLAGKDKVKIKHVKEELSF